MGVTGLWSLVDGVGHPISLETLHNKILAIDLSIWINQSIKGFRDREGRVLENAHVLGLFHRICKLLFYKIKPVFVFDGSCPQLKRHTIERRHEQRSKAIDKSREESVKIIHNYIASQFSTSVEELQNNMSLPTLQSSLIQMPKNKSLQIYEELVDLHKDNDFSDSTDESESEPNIAHNYTNFQNLDSVDINSDEFKALPIEIRYEILTELKLKYKGYRNMDIMPNETNDFSNYQMKRLLKKRGLQHKIEETIKQLNNQSTDDVIKDWNEKDFFVENEQNAGQLMSDENTRYILMKKSQTNKSNNYFNIDEEPEMAANNEMPVNDISVTSVMHSMSSSGKELTEDIIVDNPKSCEINEVNHNFVNNSIKNDINCKNFNKEEKKESLIKSVSQKLIEISDESDEEVIELKDQINCEIYKTKDNKEIDCNVEQKFTKLKSMEVMSETSDEDFIEVLSESCDSFDQLISNIDQKDLENIISSQRNQEVSMTSAENVLNPVDKDSESDLSKDCMFNSSQEINSRKSELNLSFDKKSPVEKNSLKSPLKESPLKSPLKESPLKSPLKESPLKSPLKESPMKSIASSSQSIPIDRISREEFLQSVRDMNKNDRFANSTNYKMMIDCQNLLKLFGVPFIVSPMEAEAQCAALEELGLTNGTITDDSDAFLFGAQTVYKNFFTSSKYLELYKANDIETRFGLSRSAMICIAMLCGSDYTDGVDSVGTVTATEILSEFPGDGLQPLIDFKNWWNSKKNSKDKKPENKLRAKLLKLRLSESFPNKVIFDAYINPTVDKSEEPFSWGMTRLEDLRRYAFNMFGWNQSKSDQILLPVMKKVNEKQTQLTIDSFFKIQTQPKDNITLSKRLNKAIEKLRGVESEPQSSGGINGSIGGLALKVKNQRRKRGLKTDQNKRVAKPKRIQKSTKSKPQIVNLSESSESD